MSLVDAYLPPLGRSRPLPHKERGACGHKERPPQKPWETYGGIPVTTSGTNGLRQDPGKTVRDERSR